MMAIYLILAKLILYKWIGLLIEKPYYSNSSFLGMEPTSDLSGNPISLLVERLFWLGLGIFLGGAFVKATIESIKQAKSSKGSMDTILKDLAQKAKSENDWWLYSSWM